MAASLSLTSSRLSLTLNLGEQDGKTVTATVSLSNLDGNATADTLSTIATDIANMLAYSVSTVKKYDTSLLLNE